MICHEFQLSRVQEFIERQRTVTRMWHKHGGKLTLRTVTYAENFHGGGFLSVAYGGHLYLVFAVC